MSSPSTRTPICPLPVAHARSPSFSEVLDLSDVALVGNDSGGALSQITAANHPGRIGALILTACETPADVWPPPEFAVLTAEAVKPDGLTDLMAALAQVAFRAEPVAYGLLAKHGIPLDVSDTYVQPFLENAAIRHDTHKIMSGAHERYVRAAADTLVSSWDRPALLVWAEDDPVFAPERGRAHAASAPRPRDSRWSPTPSASRPKTNPSSWHR